MDVFHVNAAGNITQSLVLIDPNPFEAVSNKQLFAECKGAATTTAGKKSSPATWDVYMRDQVNQLGTMSGGIHGGRPLADPLVALAPSSTYRRICSDKTKCIVALGNNQFKGKFENMGGMGDGVAAVAVPMPLQMVDFRLQPSDLVMTSEDKHCPDLTLSAFQPAQECQAPIYKTDRVSIRFRVAASNDADLKLYTKKKERISKFDDRHTNQKPGAPLHGGAFGFMLTGKNCSGAA